MTDAPSLDALSRMPKRRRSRWGLWLALLAAIAAGGGWYAMQAPAAPTAYDTTPVRQGDLTITVVATGTVQPTTRIDISSELSGTLESVDADFNDQVTEGQVLARLDDTTLTIRLTTAEAQLTAARARVVQAEATASETAEAFASARELDAKGLSTRGTLTAAKAAHDRAVAAVDIARADLILAEASLTEAQADLEKAVIRSPIAGIVLDRQAEKGQIVAATLNAPILFTLAEDLSRMELQVSIDEADIGRVATGNTATFTVDAYPGQTFDATITGLRFAPDDTEGVVTYTAVLSVANDKLLLRPGMTATATITVSTAADVLLVPVAALRYAPPREDASRSGRGLLGWIMPSRPQGRSGTQTDGSALWVLRGGAPVRVSVTPGATDGADIVVTSDDLAAGDEIILAEREAG